MCQNELFVMYCAGTSNGSINVFHIPEDTTAVAHIEGRRVHKKAITDISTSAAGNLIISADDGGALSAWKMEQQLKHVCEFATFG
jgi:hypothetical protein